MSLSQRGPGQLLTKWGVPPDDRPSPVRDTRRRGCWGRHPPSPGDGCRPEGGKCFDRLRHILKRAGRAPTRFPTTRPHDLTCLWPIGCCGYHPFKVTHPRFPCLRYAMVLFVLTVHAPTLLACDARTPSSRQRTAGPTPDDESVFSLELRNGINAMERGVFSLACCPRRSAGAVDSTCIWKRFKRSLDGLMSLRHRLKLI